MMNQMNQIIDYKTNTDLFYILLYIFNIFRNVLSYLFVTYIKNDYKKTF